MKSLGIFSGGLKAPTLSLIALLSVSSVALAAETATSSADAAEQTVETPAAEAPATEAPAAEAPTAEAPAAQAAPITDPGAFINHVVDTTLAALNKEGLDKAQQDQLFDEAFKAYIDIPFLGAFVTGKRYWDAAPEADKTEFLDLFQEFTVLAWGPQVRKYKGQGVTIVSVREPQSPLFSHEVITRLVPDEGPEFTLTWSLMKGETGFLIRDLAVEGARLAVKRKQEYSPVLRKNRGKLTVLNDMLRKKIEQLRSG